MSARIIIVNDRDEIIGYKERGTLAQQDIYRVSALWIKNPLGNILLAKRASRTHSRSFFQSKITLELLL